MKRLSLVTLLGVFAFNLGCLDTDIPDFIEGLSLGLNPGPTCALDILDDFPPEELRVHVIDVGQGDAIWVQTPYFADRDMESRNILIDAGPSGRVDGTAPGGEVVVKHLLEFGMGQGEILDAVIVTHAHEDHYGGLLTVLETFGVQRFSDPGYRSSGGYYEVLAKVEEALAASGGRLDVPARGRLAEGLYRSSDVFGEFVRGRLIAASEELDTGGSENTRVNNTSVVLALSFGGAQVLLMGDLEEEGEARLVQAHDAGLVDLRSRVIKVGHHGSKTSSTQAFLDRVVPAPTEEDWAIISSGVRSFGGTTLPSNEVRQRLADHFHERRVLSTENNDQDKKAGKEHGDDSILIRVQADGYVQACYIP